MNVTQPQRDAVAGAAKTVSSAARQISGDLDIDYLITELNKTGMNGGAGLAQDRADAAAALSRLRRTILNLVDP